MKTRLLRSILMTFAVAGLIGLTVGPSQWWKLVGGFMILAALIWLDVTGRDDRSRIVELEKTTSRHLNQLTGEVDAMRSEIISSRDAAADAVTRVERLLSMLQSTLVSIGESVPSAEKELATRINAFAEGILEEVAQVQLDLDRVRGGASRQTETIVRQAEAVTSLYSVLRPDKPFPTFGGWAVSPDVAKRVVSEILSARPSSALDVGSGLSTLLTAATLERIGGEGRVLALEHDEAWAERCRSLIEDHGLNHRATIIHAPLVDVVIGNEVFNWYDLTNLDSELQFDLVFVDGPPKSIGEWARYPALPILEARIRPHGVLFLDDAARPEEQQVIERWNDEFPEWKTTMHQDEKGTAELRRVPE